MNVPRITIVGAGSHFTMGLFGDFLRIGDMQESELVLMDIDEKKLRIMERILKRFTEKESIGVKIVATVNLNEALNDTDFVITTIRHGGLEALKTVITIPLQFGAVQVVGDTAGPSGVLKGMLEIPALLYIAQNVKDIAPKAVIMNFTNPMTPACMAIRKSTRTSIIGLCHGYHNICDLASKLLGYSIGKIRIEAAGINHLTWTTNITYDGESIYEEFLKSLFIRGKEEILREHPYLVGRELYKVFGIPPTLSDRHTSEFFHYLYDWIKNPIYGPILMESSGYIDYDKKTLRKEVVKREEEEKQRMIRMAEGEERITIHPSGEYAIDIASAIIHKKRTEVMALNIENRGAITGINPDHIVEVPAVIDGNSITLKGKFKLPETVVNILNAHLEKFKVMIDGIIEKDRNLLVRAIALDPLTPSPDKAEKILSRFIEDSIIRKYLSTYNFDLSGSV